MTIDHLKKIPALKKSPVRKKLRLAIFKFLSFFLGIYFIERSIFSIRLKRTDFDSEMPDLDPKMIKFVQKWSNSIKKMAIDHLKKIRDLKKFPSLKKIRLIFFKLLLSLFLGIHFIGRSIFFD